MEKKKLKLAFPHVMVLLVALVLIACILSYIVPAGQYEYDENGYVIADSFHYVENTPVSPWAAVIKLTGAIASMGTTYALLFVIGGMVAVLISSGAVENIVDWNEKHRLAKAEFGCNLLTRELLCDTSAGIVRRETHRNTSWQQARFETCHHKWCEF